MLSLVFFFALASISGCASVAGSAGVNWAAQNPGPTPDFENAKTQAMEEIRRQLKDPDSAQFRTWTPFFKMLYNYGFGAVGQYEPLWALCAEVNAKNSYGGYAGFTWWYVKFRDGRTVRDSIGVGPGEYECRNGPADPSRRAHW